MFEPGTSVRVKSDPGRVGVLTNNSRQRGPIILHQVIFPDGPQYIPEDQLESADQIPDPLVLLEQGKLGRSADLRRNLTHVRLSGRLANLIYSMDTTNTDFYAYQFKPVIRFLDSPGNGILIADEVGLGKTIEAGLIWTELRSRVDARRLMVLCPAMLRDKWRTELRKRFGIDAQILDATGVLSQLQTSLSEGDYASFSFIASLQGLRPFRGWRRAEQEGDQRLPPSSKLARFLDDHADEEPLIDLLIVDEAHYMRNRETMSADLGRLLRHVSAHVVLLSATPIHLRNQDLYQLLNLVDEDTFNQPLVFDSILEANTPLVRTREEIISQNPGAEKIVRLLNDALAHPYLSNSRQLRAILASPPTQDLLEELEYRSRLSFQLESMNLLGNVVNRTRKREVNEWRVLREAVPEQVALTPAERAFYDSVTNLVREFCTQYGQAEGFLLVMPQRQVASSMPAALRDWQRRGEDYASQIYEDLGGDETPATMGPIVREIISRAHELGDLEELWNNDSKFERLAKVVLSHLKKYPKEKIVLFSYFRPTLTYLYERLSRRGVKCAVLMGGGGWDRDDILSNFEKPDGPNLLLSSEVASEGIDLQFCRVVINYDLPWNPMRVEQRIGRIDRLGQESPRILIWNLFAEDTIDARIYTKLYERLGIFERALGGLEAVLGEEIRKLTLDLMSSSGLTPEQEEERIEQTAQALVNIRMEEARLEEESAKLIAHGDYILNQVKAARELNRLISGHDLWVYVRDFLQKNYPGCTLQQILEDNLIFDVALSTEAKYALRDFLEKKRISQLTRLARASSSPVRCIFENRVSAPERKREEIISQFHPLVRFVSSQIIDSKESYYPAVSISLSKLQCPQIPEGIYVFSVQRWSIQGIQDRERLCFAAKKLENDGVLLSEDDSERLVTSAALNGQDWLSAPNLVNMETARRQAQECLEVSYASYDEHVTQVENENNDRADIQEKALERHLNNQLQRLEEVKRGHIVQGRDALAKAIQGKIDALKSRVQMRIMEIKERRVLKHRCDELCVGLIRLSP